ncbi:MAG: type II secretion system protein GspG [Acidobacteriota bacterium]
MRRHQAHGLTLAQVLGIVLVLGLVAAIVVPNLLNAINRGKQKRTTGDIRTVATAVESYRIDEKTYPVFVGRVPVEMLIPLIQPTYLKAIPLVDGWGGPLLYESADGTKYVIRSLAKDGVPSGPTQGATTDFRHDIVFDTGSFVVVPEGTRG